MYATAQLTDYYTKLRGIGVAEAQDVMEVSDVRMRAHKCIVQFKLC